MKKYTNLLPKEEQREISLEKISGRLFRFFLVILASLCILIVAFAAGRLYLQAKISSIRDRIELQENVVSKEDNLKLKQELNEFNGHLSNLVNMEQHHAQWSEVLIEFARLLPQDVAVDSISASRETGFVRITGFALNRDSVLQLRKDLLASPYFKDVNFPLSNLNRATNVTFSYSFFIDQSHLVPSVEQ